MRVCYLIIIVLLLFSCNKKINKDVVAEEFYPQRIKFKKKSYLSYDKKNQILFERLDSLSSVHFLEFKKDTILLNTKEVILPSFIKDVHVFQDGFSFLNTHPRTLGKNKKTTDFITKYDKESKIIIQKDLDVSKYPSGNSLVVDNGKDLFYLTSGFKFREKRKLVVSKIDDSLNLSQIKFFENQSMNSKYNPIECIVIKDIGIAIVSEVSEFQTDNTIFRIDMLDFDLNIKWSKEFVDEEFLFLGYSQTEKRIYAVTKGSVFKVKFWDSFGGKIIPDYNLELNIKSAVSNDDSIYLLGEKSGKTLVENIVFTGNKFKKKTKVLKNTKYDFLTLRDGTLFAIYINNENKTMLTESVFFSDKNTVVNQ